MTFSQTFGVVQPRNYFSQAVPVDVLRLIFRLVVADEPAKVLLKEKNPPAVSVAFAEPGLCGLWSQRYAQLARVSKAWCACGLFVYLFVRQPYPQAANSHAVP